MKNYTITLNGETLNIKLSFRSLMTFERLTGKNYTDITSLEDTLIYMYSCIICNNEIKLDFDTFINQLDEEPGALEQFLNGLQNTDNEKK